MRNQTIATHLVREIQVQHTLLATLLTTITQARMTTVSINPHSSSALVSSQPECISWLPFTMIFFLFHFVDLPQVLVSF